MSMPATKATTPWKTCWPAPARMRPRRWRKPRSRRCPPWWHRRRLRLRRRSRRAGLAAVEQRRFYRTPEPAQAFGEQGAGVAQAVAADAEFEPAVVAGELQGVGHGLIGQRPVAID